MPVVRVGRSEYVENRFVPIFTMRSQLVEREIKVVFGKIDLVMTVTPLISEFISGTDCHSWVALRILDGCTVH